MTTEAPSLRPRRPAVRPTATTTATPEPRWPTRRLRRVVTRVLVGGALAVATLASVYPFIWLVSASFKPRGEVFDNRLIPQTFTFDNYLEIWQQAPMGLWLLNTAIVTVLATVTVTISSAMVAWGFSYFRFPLRGPLFGVLLATLMIPGAVTMIPVYLIWDALGATGTLVPLWAGNLFGSAFYIFLIRQFFLSLPPELFEAAKIDGAGNWAIFRHIALPLTKPALVVTALFEFEAAWTDLMRPLIYLRDADTFTVPRGLKAMLDQYGFGGNWHWELIITASVIATVPVVVIFLIGQRHFIEGISTTGAHQ